MNPKILKEMVIETISGYDILSELHKAILNAPEQPDKLNAFVGVQETMKSLGDDRIKIYEFYAMLHSYFRFFEKIYDSCHHNLSRSEVIDAFIEHLKNN